LNEKKTPSLREKSIYIDVYIVQKFFKFIMEKSTNIKYKILNDALSSQPVQTATKLKQSKRKRRRRRKLEAKECSECKKIRKPYDENHQICYTCYYAKKRIILSRNKVIDDFIRYTQINCPYKNGKMIFVPYEKFENIKLVGEGGFSKIYKATWIDCKISYRGNLDHSLRNKSKTVALKKLNNSKNITSRELNEVNISY
jgi:hypothetical protein